MNVVSNYYQFKIDGFFLKRRKTVLKNNYLACKCTHSKQFTKTLVNLCIVIIISHTFILKLILP